MEVNVAYIAGQVAKACNRPEDTRYSAEENAARREERVQAWSDILRGVSDGQVLIGTRTPLKAANGDGGPLPSWVTPDVFGYGFSSGRMAAKLQVAAKEGGVGYVDNKYYMSKEGLLELRELLHSGKYQIEFPEHGALLASVWFLEQGDVSTAEDLNRCITPYLDELQFFPQKCNDVLPAEANGMVFPLMTVEDGKEWLHQKISFLTGYAGTRVGTMISREMAFSTWLPMKWEILGFFAKTTTMKTTPRNTTSNTGTSTSTSTSESESEHEWPCQVYPDGWKDTVQDIVARYDDLREACRLKFTNKNKHVQVEWISNRKAVFERKRGSSLAFLIRCLRALLKDGPQSLTGRDVAMIKLMLESCVRKRGGLPGSDSFERNWGSLKDAHGGFLAATVDMLKQCVSYLDGPRFLLRESITEEELSGLQVQQAGSPYFIESVYPVMKKMTPHALEHWLTEGLIKSAESVSNFMLPITAHSITIAVCEDKTLGNLLYSLVLSFMNRRSLLLLDMSHQVRMQEIPWINALLKESAGKDTQKSAVSTLRRLVQLVLEEFPETQVPNLFLSSLRVLMSACGFPTSGKGSIPLVEELAADLFQSFSAKFATALLIAARTLKHTAYSRHFALDGLYSEVLSMEKSDNEIAEFLRSWACNSCPHSLKGSKMILERAQIATTHNLATFFTELEITVSNPTETIRKIWAFILNEYITWSGLDCRHVIKRIAYAWRQLVFFLSVGEVARTVDSQLEVVSILQTDFEKKSNDRFNNFSEWQEHMERRFLKPIRDAITSDGNEEVSGAVFGWSTANNLEHNLYFRVI